MECSSNSEPGSNGPVGRFESIGRRREIFPFVGVRRARMARPEAGVTGGCVARAAQDGWVARKTLEALEERTGQE